MGVFNRLFGKKAVANLPDIPFMEHPTGDFKCAADAMTDAIKRLRALPEWSNWITFCAQGMGHDENSARHAKIRLRKDELQLDVPVDLERVSRNADVPRSRLAAIGESYSITGASPAETALILDAIFRHDLGIRPFPDQRDDYAIGAEW